MGTRLSELGFDLPPIGKTRPKWNGQNFTLKGSRISVLEYSENDLGWTDEHTSLHESSAGDNHPIDVASRRNAHDQISRSLATLQGTPTILEIGCSSGFLLREIKSAHPDAMVIGADVVHGPLDKLGQETSGIPLIRFDITQNPFPDKIVDVVVMVNVLEHIDDDQRAIDEVFRLLKPGGRFVIEVPAGPKLFDDYDRALNHFRRYTFRELRQKLKNAGFRIERSTHLGFLVYPVFALIKLARKRRGENARDVSTSIKDTSQSRLLQWSLQLESLLSGVHLPWGIRVLTTAVKDPDGPKTR